MSLQQHHDAQLKTYQGPHFTSALQKLQSEFDAYDSLNLPQLRAMAEKVPGFTLMNRPKTSDSYYWYWGLYFTVNNGDIAILLPWSRDQGKHDDSRADRSCALYVRRASLKSANRVVKNLTARMAKQAQKAH